MRKFVNFRLPVMIAVLLALGIATGYFLSFYKITPLYLIAVVPVAAIFFIVFTIKSKRIIFKVYTLLFAAIFIAGALNCYMRLYCYSRTDAQENINYNVSGRVVEIIESGNAGFAVLNGLKFNGKSAGGKLILYLNGNDENFDVGYTLNLYGELQTLGAFKDGKLSYYAERNVKYRAVNYGVISSEYGYSLFGKIKNEIRRTLFTNLEGDTAAVCFAMLTGDTQAMDEGVLKNFRYGGIAHIFAVSGLHIGIVFAIISFITRKLKINKYAAAAINCGCVLLYAGICSFTLSSVRALIMCFVGALCKLTKRKYDGFNALAFSSAAILLVTPLSLFAAGFQLSVCAVGGILTLSKPLYKKMKKLPKSVASSLSVSLSAQAGALPVMIAQFGYLSWAGLLLNIVVVPIISVLFVPLFAGVFLSVIFPFLGQYCVYYCALPVSAVTSFLINFGFENAILTTAGAKAFAPLYMICLLFAGDKINLKKYERLEAVSLSFLALVSYSVATW